MRLKSRQEKKLNCFDCGKPFKKGDQVYEFTTGTFDGEIVISNESLEHWCEECEQKRSNA